jgi:hypothetical protein
MSLFCIGIYLRFYSQFLIAIFQPSCLGSSAKELLPRHTGEYRVRFPGEQHLANAHASTHEPEAKKKCYISISIFSYVIVFDPNSLIVYSTIFG